MTFRTFALAVVLLIGMVVVGGGKADARGGFSISIGHYGANIHIGSRYRSHYYRRHYYYPRHYYPRAYYPRAYYPRAYYPRAYYPRYYHRPHAYRYHKRHHRRRGHIYYRW